MSTQQQTLNGEEANDERVRPGTMVYCGECEEFVLRSNRFKHEHDLSDVPNATELRKQREREQKIGGIEDQVPDHALFDTKTYEVTFHYEMRETVIVEASTKGEAKEFARDLQTYDGEITHTLHTDKRVRDGPSQASVDHLEMLGLLPEDHDVTDEDIQALLDWKEENDE
jgi:hypothetical protein